MQNNGNSAAIQRGIRAAGLWKRARRLIKAWDTSCIKWTGERNLPNWLGHTPVLLLICSSIILAFLGGIIVIGTFFAVWAIILFLCQGRTQDVKTEKGNDAPEYYSHRQQHDPYNCDKWFPHSNDE